MKDKDTLYFATKPAGELGETQLPHGLSAFTGHWTVDIARSVLGREVGRDFTTANVRGREKVALNRIG